MLRTLFVLAILAFGLRHALRGPFYALLLYLFVAYFRPEQWVWGDFIRSLNLSFYLGMFALAMGVFTGQLRLSSRMLPVALLVLQSLISTSLSSHSTWSWPYWVDFAKSSVITWLIASFVTDLSRFRLVVLVISLSLGFESAKQGLVMFVLNPGMKNFNEIAFLGDNNAAAIGMLVLTALLVALARTAHTRAERWLHRILAFGVLYRGITTYSRGGFIAAAVMGLMYLLRSKRKFAAIAGMALVILVIAPVLPSEFWDRMSTISFSVATRSDTVAAAEADPEQESALSRIHFWRVGVTMATAHPFVGVGHNAYTKAYNDYDFSRGAFGLDRSVHSSWFGLLAELGYPGVLLFGISFLLALVECRRARRLQGQTPQIVQLREFGIMLETGLIVVLVGGSFVILQYTELLWHMIGLTIALRQLTDQALAAVTTPSQKQTPAAFEYRGHVAAAGDVAARPARM